MFFIIELIILAESSSCLPSLFLSLLSLLAKAIDAYIEATSPESSTSGEASPDPRLRSIVDQMFSRCIADKDYKQALGIALETSRLDVIEEVFNVTRDQGLLAYVLEAVMGVVHALNLRNQVSASSNET